MSGEPERNLAEQPAHVEPLLPVPPQQEQQQHPPTQVPASTNSPSPTTIAAPSDVQSIPSSPPINEQARVAVVLYDMILRGGRNAQPLSAQLAAAYPAAASIANQYAGYARYALRMHTPPEQPAAADAQRNEARTNDAQTNQAQDTARQRRNDFVLSRISVFNVAWFFFFIASMQASLHICLIFALALLTIYAKSSGSPVMSLLVSRLVENTLGDGPKLDMFKWVVRMLTERNPIVEFGMDYGWGPTHVLKSYLPAVILLTPILMGMVAFVAGGLVAMAVNLALKAAGGIRFMNRSEHED